jgi:hypothetical protein
MKPIRVVTPGGAPILPFRMLALGSLPVVNVELYVIGEGRYALPELTEVFLRRGALTWDSATQGSNFEALRSAALAENDGFSFFTAFASEHAFGMLHYDAKGNAILFHDSNLTTLRTLADLYFAQGRLEAPTGKLPCGSVAAELESELEVVEVNPQGPEQLDGSRLACGPMGDLQQALIGLHPRRTWLTRLDLELRPAPLTQDYLVEQQPFGTTVSPAYVPERLINAPAGCEEPIFQSSVAPRRVRPFGWGTLPFLLVCVVLRRRFRRARGVT